MGGITISATEPIFILSNSWEMTFQSIPLRLPLVLSGGCTSAGVVEGGTPAHTPRRDVSFFWVRSQPVLGSLWSPVPRVSVGCGRSHQVRGKKPLGANSHGLSYCPPDVRPLDSSLLVPEILVGSSHSAGGGSLAL